MIEYCTYSVTGIFSLSILDLSTLIDEDAFSLQKSYFWWISFKPHLFFYFVFLSLWIKNFILFTFVVNTNIINLYLQSYFVFFYLPWFFFATLSSIVFSLISFSLLFLLLPIYWFRSYAFCFYSSSSHWQIFNKFVN